MEFVSVVLPYFNRQDSLWRAVDSVLSQSHSNLELLLIDDGSTDGSRRIAEEFDDRRVRLLGDETNRGVSLARNLGLESATSDLIAFMDSDDEWLPNKLEFQVAYLRSVQQSDSRVSVVGCGWRYAGGLSDRTFSRGPFDRRDVLWGASGLGTPMLLVDRVVAASGARFDPALSALVDRDYVLSCLRNDSRVVVLPDVLAEVTRGRSDHVANPSRAAASYAYYLQKYQEEFSADPGLFSFYNYRAAREFLRAHKPRSAYPHIASALARYPFRRAFHLILGGAAGSKGLAIAQRVCPGR